MTYDIKPGAVLHGDSLAVMRQMEPCSVDAVITDPPYSSGGQFRGDRAQSTRDKYLSSGQIAAEYAKHSFTGDNLDQRAWTSWAAEWLSLARAVTKPGGVAAVFTDWRQIGALCDAMQWAGWVWRGVLVWDKKNSIPQPGRPRQQCEFIVWASNGPLDVKRNAPFMPGIFTAPPPRVKSVYTKPKNRWLLCVSWCISARRAVLSLIRLRAAVPHWQRLFLRATTPLELKKMITI